MAKAKAKMTDTELLKWAADQRKAYHDGRLSADRIRKLESIRGWTWNDPEPKRSTRRAV